MYAERVLNVSAYVLMCKAVAVGNNNKQVFQGPGSHFLLDTLRRSD